jgi:transposase
MPHRNARLTVHGRKLLVDRVSSGRPVAHVAKEVGVSRQCAHRWVARYAAEGEAGLQDRSSRPQHHSRRTSPAVEAAVVAARRQHRRGSDWLAAELGVPARTVSRILRRHQLPYLADCDPQPPASGVAPRRRSGSRRLPGPPTCCSRGPGVSDWSPRP